MKLSISQEKTFIFTYHVIYLQRLLRYLISLILHVSLSRSNGYNYNSLRYNNFVNVFDMLCDSCWKVQ